jgi:hypothetical protein
VGQIMLRDSQTGLYREEYFKEFLALAKKRFERSEGPAFLMLADLSAFTDVSERQKVAKSMIDSLSAVTRDTDVKGWFVEGLVIGIMFTEMAGKAAISRFAQRKVVNKCLGCLQSHLGVKTFSRIQISWQSVQTGCILEFRDVSMGSF